MQETANILCFLRKLLKQGVRRLKIRRSFYWAASFLLFLSIGTFGTLYFGEKTSRYQFLSSEIQPQSNEARLLLSDGEEINLTAYNSKLSLISDSELLLNNDTVIDLSQKEIKNDSKVQMNEVVIPYGKKSELLLANGTKDQSAPCGSARFGCEGGLGSTDLHRRSGRTQCAPKG